MEKNSFVFYRSFSEAMRELSEADQLQLYRAIVGYGLDADEPTFGSAYLRMAWKLIRPQLDANWRRYKNGCKGAQFGKLGGAPKGNKNASRAKQPQNNPKTTPNDNVNDNVNDNEEIEKEDLSSVSVSPAFTKFQDWFKSSCPHLMKMEQQMTEKEFNTVVEAYGKKPVFDTLLKMENYRDTAKKNRSVYRTLRNWINRELTSKKGGEQ